MYSPSPSDQPRSHFSLSGHNLSETDMNIIRAYNYKVNVNLGDRAFIKLPQTFPGPPIRYLPTLACIRHRIEFVSGIEPIHYHCCIKSCYCFAGPFATQTTCPYCGESRYTASGSPRKILQYIPLIPSIPMQKLPKHYDTVITTDHGLASQQMSLMADTTSPSARKM
jgi:hypothetical protein